jgi:penicillin-binding protein-related factor A (putative recombinase)
VKDDMLGFKNARNYCDFFAYSSPHLYLFELKSTKQKSLPFGNISQFQIDSLYHYSKYQGIKAGFVINFYSIDYQTYFLPAEKAYFFYHSDGRKSFPIAWVKENGILLPATLIRTRYRFDLSPLFQSQ